jgi:membrane fusion protein (multidrug efflux system)
MYARIKAESRRSEDVIVIPSSSVNFAPYGNSVFVVEKEVDKGKDNGDKDTFVLRQQVVQLGRRRGDFVAVISGLTEGAQVVNSGTFKLRAGSLVKIISEPALKNEYNPSPANS